jgi:hypothetical protein
VDVHPALVVLDFTRSKQNNKIKREDLSMKQHTAIALLTTLSMFSAGALAERQDMVPGNWEFTIDYDLIGVPQTFPSYTVRQCLDKNTPYPSISRPGNECETQMQGHFGHTYTWMLNCSTDWEMVQGVGRMHYLRDTAHGDVHLQILNPHNPPQPMVFHIKGHYLGPCEK